MQKLTKLIESSFIFRFISFFINEAAHSFFFRATFEPQITEMSAIYRGSAVFGFLHRALSFEKISQHLSKLYEQSVSVNLFRLIQTKMAESSSLVLRALSKFRLVYLVMLYPVLAYALRYIFFGGKLSRIWDEALMLLLFVVVIARLIFTPQKWKSTNISQILLMFILVMVFLLTVESPNLSTGIEGLRAVVQYMLWFFAAVQLIDRKEDITNLVCIGLVMGGAVGLHAIYQYITKAPMLGNWVDATEVITSRAFSIMLSPNLLGSFFALFLPVAFSLIFAGRNSATKTFALISFGLMGLGLLFTFSRGAWLAAFAGLSVFLLATYKKLLLPVIIAATAALISIPALGDRFFRLFTFDYYSRSAVGGRVFRLTKSLEVWSKKPIFGEGLGRFGGAVAINNNLSTFYTDNYYLKTLVETGIVGLTSMLILFISLIVASIAKIRSISDKNSQVLMYGLMSGQVAVLIHNFSENIFESPAMSTLFWLFAAIIMAYPSQSDN